MKTPQRTAPEHQILREYLARTGLSQRHVAHRMGVARSSVQRWVQNRGRMLPVYRHLIRWLVEQLPTKNSS